MILLENEKIFPIFITSATWSQDDLDRNNGTSFYRMYPIGTTIEQARQDAIKWWEELITSEKYADKNPQLISLNVRFFANDTWCITWFSHYTLNTHLSDAELLTSFENFTTRKRVENYNNGHDYDDRRDEAWGPFYCLMGAEDRWRWKDPCRCASCQKRGLVRIDH
jgi:hypothetical protein